MHTLPKFVRLTAMSSVLAIGLAAVPASAAPVITAVNADLTSAPFSFSYLGGTFTFGSTGDIFAPLSVSAADGAAVSAFGGFLGIPLKPSSFFTDRGTVISGPGFGQFASFATLTPVDSSNGDNFLNLRVTSGGQNYYGFAYTTNATLNSYGFETSPETAITATTAIPAAVPEPATWAMMLVGFGAVGFAMRRRKSERGAVPLAA